MKTFRALAIFALAVLLIGLVLSVPVQMLCVHFGWFAQKPWSKFFSRCVMVGVVISLWPLLRSLGMNSCQGIGLHSKVSDAGVRIAVGWVGSAVMVLGLGWVAVMAGFRRWEDWNWGVLLKPFLVGVTVGLFEEILFRGLIFGALRREWSLAGALLASSLFYASLHFVAVHPASWLAGVVAFASLTGFGVLLAWCYARSGSLYLSIGVHAGCVTALRCWLSVTSGRGIGTELDWLFGSGNFKLVSGVGVWPVLLLLWLGLMGAERLLSRYHDRRDQEMGRSQSGAGLPG